MAKDKETNKKVKKEIKTKSKSKSNLSLTVTNNDKEEIIAALNKEITNKVKDKITKDIIDDIKDDIKVLVKDEVKNDLVREIERDIKKENKRLIRRKNRKIFSKNIIILVLIAVIAGLVYYMYNQGDFNITINNLKDTKKVDSSVSSSIENESNETDYSYLLDIPKVNLYLDNVNSLYIYSDNLDEKSIPDSIKLNMAYKYILKDEFTTEEMKNAYKKVFGTDTNYKNTSFDYECKHFEVKDHKYYLANNKCTKIQNKEIIEKIMDIKQDNNKIIINTVMGLYDKNNNSLYDYKNIYKAVSTNVPSNYDILDYKSHLSSFEYVFTFDSSNYYFTSITNK